MASNQKKQAVKELTAFAGMFQGLFAVAEELNEAGDGLEGRIAALERQSPDGCTAPKPYGKSTSANNDYQSRYSGQGSTRVFWVSTFIRTRV